jgi:hypothetical protein
MMTRQEFHERLAKSGNLATLNLSEVAGFKTSDFPPSAKIRVLNDTRSRYPSLGFWRVRKDRFESNVSILIHAQTPWPHAVTPTALLNLLEAGIKERGKQFSDCQLDQSIIAPLPGIEFACGFALTPPQKTLGPAFRHAVSTYDAISSLVDRASALRTISVDTKRHINMPPDRRIFEAAETFRNAAYTIYRHACGEKIDPNTQLLLIRPAIVNGAFALELYLKCIYRVETGHWLKKREHDLRILFKKITKPTRDKVVKYYNAGRATDPKFHMAQEERGKAQSSFGTELRKAARVFEKFRYLHETPSTPQDFSFGSVQSALQRVIIEMRPYWTVLRATEPVVVNPHAQFVKREY